MALRLIEFLVPQNGVQLASEVLRGLNIVQRWDQNTPEDLTAVHVLAEASQVEAIIQAMEKTFAHHEGFRAILTEVMATSPAPEAPEEEPEQADTEPEAEKPSPERVACLELTEKLGGATEISRNYIPTILLSAIVAAVGLVRNSVAIIIGAMVIAPFLSPNMALALATTLGDTQLARRALKSNWAGIGIALILAVVLGFVMPIHPQINEIASPADVGYSDIILALAAGCAGALAFTSGVSAALVGVMVAVAILPPLVAAGLLLGSGYPVMGIKALLLALANIICVNIAGVGMFLFQGIRPRHYWESTRAKRMVRVAIFVWAGLLALLVGVIYLSQQFIGF